MLTKASSQKPSAISNIFVKLLPVALWVVPFFSSAQCAMCRASLESEGDKTRIEAVNDGIILLMAIPYLIVAGIGYAIYRMYFRKKNSTHN